MHLQRFLAAMAYLNDQLVPGLCLLQLGRQPMRPVAALLKHRHRLCLLRPVARCGLAALAWGLATGLCAAFGVMTAKARKKLESLQPALPYGLVQGAVAVPCDQCAVLPDAGLFCFGHHNTDPFAVYGSLLQGWDGLAGSWAQVSGLIYSSGIDGRLPVVLLFGCFVVFAAEHGGHACPAGYANRSGRCAGRSTTALPQRSLSFAAFGQSAFIYQQY